LEHSDIPAESGEVVVALPPGLIGLFRPGRLALVDAGILLEPGRNSEDDDDDEGTGLD